jgi:hypothetical protein
MIVTPGISTIVHLPVMVKVVWMIGVIEAVAMSADKTYAKNVLHFRMTKNAAIPVAQLNKKARRIDPAIRFFYLVRQRRHAIFSAAPGAATVRA